MSARMARCACGDLRVALEGEPDFVMVCHCRECQRRTGSAFGVGAYYPRASATPDGAYATYSREGSSGKALRFHFCGRCGSTVFWDVEVLPRHVGIAVGALGDAAVPAPARSVWEETRHAWVEFACELARSPRQGS